MPRNMRETISFRVSVPAGTTQTYEQEITGDGTIDKLSIRFYPGQQKSLRIRPRVIFRTDEYIEMVRFAGNTDAFLSGDDDILDYPLAIAVRVKDRIVLEVENTDSANDYSVVADVTVSYADVGKQVGF